MSLKKVVVSTCLTGFLSSGCLAIHSGKLVRLEDKVIEQEVVANQDSHATKLISHNKRYGESDCIRFIDEIFEHNQAYFKNVIPREDIDNLEPVVHEFRHALNLYLHKFMGKVWVIPAWSFLPYLPPWAMYMGAEHTRIIQAPEGKDNKLSYSYLVIRGIFDGPNMAFWQPYLVGEKEGIELRTPMHEFAHMLQFVAQDAYPPFKAELEACFNAAKGRDLFLTGKVDATRALNNFRELVDSSAVRDNVFLDSYSRTDVWEYFAEGVVAYLNTSENEEFQRKYENFVSRDELKRKDPVLFAYVKCAFDIVEVASVEFDKQQEEMFKKQLKVLEVHK